MIKKGQKISREIVLPDELKEQWGDYNISHEDLAKIISDKTETEFTVLRVVSSYECKEKLGMDKFDEYVFLVRKDDLEKLYQSCKTNEQGYKYFKVSSKWKEIDEDEVYFFENESIMKFNGYPLSPAKVITNFFKENICLLRKQAKDNLNLENFNWFVPYVLEHYSLGNLEKMEENLYFTAENPIPVAEDKKLIESMQNIFHYKYRGSDKDMDLSYFSESERFNFQPKYVKECLNERMEKIKKERGILS